MCFGRRDLRADPSHDPIRDAFPPDVEHEVVADVRNEGRLDLMRPGDRLDGPPYEQGVIPSYEGHDRHIPGRGPADLRDEHIEVGPEALAAERMDVATAMLDDSVREEQEISTGWRWNAGGTCTEPLDDRLWHALTAHAVASLAGRRISFRGGADRWLVPTHPGPGGSTVEEIELVAFPPTRGADRGYYPEGGAPHDRDISGTGASTW
ncbi:hypothetical protein GGQ91_000973 [Methylobacterium fujisawaense]|uniref:Uncharacterized protein n=1 Tax=Methylobacterium fujisawaense TaxID=107400 RepID=A0ABR6D6A2_9HYPH|nr:hypothetical protein [Methylobacterium fujisawaense]MBA9061612.1 hypothetical protein [Methylobacterium fujisawaense]